jgi:hypothetical protein
MKELNQALKEYNKLLKYLPKLKAKGYDVRITFDTEDNIVTLSIYKKDFEKNKEKYFFVFTIIRTDLFINERAKAIATLEELSK